jgi:hypothetical protein
MFTWFTRLGISTSLLATLSLTACQKDEVKVVATPSGQPMLTAAGTSNQVLLQSNASANAVTYTWTPVTFGFQSVAPTYSLQFDKKGNNFASAQSIDAGTALTKTLTVSDLNTVYQSLKLVNTTQGAQQAASTLDVRVIASIGTPDGAKSTSAISSLTATPYSFCTQPAQAWGLIGPAGISWDADVTMTYDCASNSYSYTGPLKVGAFKFRFNKDWKSNLGGSSSTGGALTQGGSDMNITTAKTYTIVLTPTIDTSGNASGSYTIQ